MTDLLWWLGIFAVGNLNGWFLRMFWEWRNPRYIVVPDVDETRDNTAVLQHAIDLAARLKGRVKHVHVRKGTFPTGPLHIGGVPPTAQP